MKTALSFATVCLVWGVTWFVIATQLGVVPSGWSVSYRFLIAGATLLGWCALRGGSMRIPRSSILFVVALGLFQFVLNFNFVYRAEEHITSGLVAVAYALMVPLNALFAFLILKRQPSRYLLMGALLGLIGTAMMFTHEMGNAVRGNALLGIGLAIAGVVCTAVANIMQASRAGGRLPPLAALGWAMLTGALINIPFTWVADGPPVWDHRPEYLVGLVFLSVIGSALCSYLYFGLVRTMGPAEAAWALIIIPIVAMLVSTLLEGYRWTALSAIGATLAIGGMAVALRKPQRQPARAAQLAQGQFRADAERNAGTPSGPNPGPIGEPSEKR